MLLRYFFVGVILYSLCSCNNSANEDIVPNHRFQFDPGNLKIRLNKIDTSFLINYYMGFQNDRVDTFDWPLPENSENFQLIIDVSGTMFMESHGVFKDQKTVTFFDFALQELIAFIKSNDYFKNASTINIKLFGSKPAGKSFIIADYQKIIIPCKKIVVNESFYRSDHNRIQVKCLQELSPISFNLYDSIENAIKRLVKPYNVNPDNMVTTLNESPLLENIIYNCGEYQSSKGHRRIFYMTDGYFRIDGAKDMVPGSSISLNNLKNQFKDLKVKMTNYSGIDFTFYGMNTKEDLDFREKLNGFYRWFLNDSINNVTIYNLK